ncbi:MAG: nucleoid-associated protein [Paludibacteraceae bacterium]|nr:nucleoid-associated protein [Paludibacteraceae bacterium]MBR6041384.1 nucleoid-associated protein [Paludibacteraceae bacterium]MCR5567974.1 nucleoid-associated protein [Paludibacteraceae bacterium]
MIFDISNAKINKLVIHKIGSHSENVPTTYSNQCLKFSDDSIVPDHLKQYFLATFREPHLYNLSHENGIQDNMVYRISETIFEQPDTFYENSRVLADLLYKSSSNANIKPGEFYVTLFEDVQILDQTVLCLGLFKSENKETFLKVHPEDGIISVDCEEGINIKKLDKGCLIFNIEKENGYIVSVVDKVSKGNEAVFWKDDFLGLSEREDNNFDTMNYLNICKEFVDQIYAPINEVPRESQIDMQNRTIDYFKTNEEFNEDVFKTEVLGGNEEIVRAFDECKENYESERGINVNKEFAISNEVVKQENKRFRSVIKLDKNFHVYVHGNQAMMQRGYDEEKKLYYYTLYFATES